MTAGVLPWVWAYLLVGAAFGLATFSHKHLFSEGPESPAGAQQPDAMNGRLMWVLICSCLWPVMALTGVYSFWRLRRQRAAEALNKTPRDKDN